MHNDNERPAPERQDSQQVVEQLRAYASRRSGGVEVHRFVLRHGRAFAKPVWRPLLHSRPRQCFLNATTAALAHDDLIYVEGFIWSDQVPFLVEHAWCADAFGQPVEVTLPRGVHTHLQYYGVALTRGFVGGRLEQGAPPPLLDRVHLTALEALSTDLWRHPVNDGSAKVAEGPASDASQSWPQCLWLRGLVDARPPNHNLAGVCSLTEFNYREHGNDRGLRDGRLSNWLAGLRTSASGSNLWSRSDTLRLGRAVIRPLTCPKYLSEVRG